jgi:hypothetical protein
MLAQKRERLEWPQCVTSLEIVFIELRAPSFIGVVIE